jgi:hypothetical protein
MNTFPDVPRAAAMVALAFALGLVPACGGDDGDASPLEGARVWTRDEALRLLARGAVAPIQSCELAHAALVRQVGSRPIEGVIAVGIEAADPAEALLLGNGAGSLRAVLRFEGAVVGVATLDGTVALEVSRDVAGAGSAHRCQADSLSLRDSRGTAHWSHLDVAVDAGQLVQRMSVVSDLTEDPAAPLWMDVVASAPARLDPAPAGATLSSGRYVATGIIGFVNARLMLQVDKDGAWTIAVDNDKDDQVDFVVHANADEVRALTSSR